MKLDSEQKRVLKAISGSSLGYIIGYPLIMWIGGKLDSWKDALAWLGVGLVVAVVMGGSMSWVRRFQRKTNRFECFENQSNRNLNVRNEKINHFGSFFNSF